MLIMRDWSSPTAPKNGVERRNGWRRNGKTRCIL